MKKDYSQIKAEFRIQDINLTKKELGLNFPHLKDYQDYNFFDDFDQISDQYF